MKGQEDVGMVATSSRDCHEVTPREGHLRMDTRQPDCKKFEVLGRMKSNILAIQLQ